MHEDEVDGKARQEVDDEGKQRRTEGHTDNIGPDLSCRALDPRPGVPHIEGAVNR